VRSAAHECGWAGPKSSEHAASEIRLVGNGNAKRIAVSRTFDCPEPAVGHVVGVYDLCGTVEEDGEKRIFNTPRERLNTDIQDSGNKCSHNGSGRVS
jgi:hypothetical protein